MNKKGNDNIVPAPDDNMGDAASQTETEQDSFVASEEKCDTTMHQVYENMSSRNDQAKEILADIHDDMKRAEDNISSKKADIEKMMADLKK